MDRRSEALQAALELQGAQATLVEAREQRSRARGSLLAALAAASQSAPRDAPTGILVEVADTFIRSAAEVAKARAAMETKAAVTRSALTRAEIKLNSAEAALSRLIAKWGPALSSLGFEPEAPTSVVRVRLDLLEEIRADTDEITSLRQRVAAMESDVAAFFEKVVALSAECGLDVGSRRPEEQLVSLMAGAADAMAQAQKRQTLQGQLDDARAREMAAMAAMQVARERLAPLLQAAGVDDAEGLHIVLDRAAERSSKASSAADIETEIVALGDGADLQNLLEDTIDADPDALRAQSEDLEAQLATLTGDIERLTDERALATAEFERLDDGPDAAIAASDLAQARSEMEAQAEAYVRLRAEASLLRWAIERYRREKQAPLLKRASALFSTLTLGRYAALIVDTDGSRPRLCGVTAAADQVVPVEGMSGGTVDQLYFSLRLAAVEDAIAGGLKLPFLADDLFINYDDARSKAGFSVLGELASQTQVLFFTHHEHLLKVAEQALPSLRVATCRLSA